MIKVYHNCTLETAELIKADGMIRSNAELQSRGIDRCRVTGLSTEDIRHVSQSRHVGVETSSELHLYLKSHQNAW